MRKVTQAELTERERNRLSAQVPGIRKEKEADGVTINGVRYAGDAGNRQALREAVDYADDAGLTTFAAWKDSDGVFHADHPVQDVRDALSAIAARRSALIGKEAEHVQAVLDGTITDLDALDWVV